MIKITYKENLQEIIVEKAQSYASFSEKSNFDNNLIFFKDSDNLIIGLKINIDVDLKTSFRHWTHNPDLKKIPQEIKNKINDFFESNQVRLD